MATNYQDWLRQAQRDLALARHALEAGSYEWACFAAQQSAEEALKAAFPRANRSAWGHSVSTLLQQLPPPHQAEEFLLNAGKSWISITSFHGIQMPSPKEPLVTTTQQKKPSSPSPIQSISSPSVKLFWLNLVR